MGSPVGSGPYLRLWPLLAVVAALAVSAAVAWRAAATAAGWPAVAEVGGGAAVAGMVAGVLLARRFVRRGLGGRPDAEPGAAADGGGR